MWCEGESVAQAGKGEEFGQKETEGAEVREEQKRETSVETVNSGSTEAVTERRKHSSERGTSD